LPKLCAATLRIVQREPPGGVFVQGQRLLPGMHGPADVRNGGTRGRCPPGSGHRDMRS
jgi:hypothetical protein